MRGIGGAAARRLLLVLALVLVPLAASAQFVSPLEPLDTTSPRDTYLAFRALGDELDAAFTAYEADPSFAGQARLRAVLARTDQLFDLTETPVALRSETGRAAFGSLKDVLMRMPPIDPATLPGDEGAPDRVRLPGSEIDIVRIAEGPDRGAFLFSANTVARLPEFRDRIIDYPVLGPAPYQSWRDEQIRFSGPLVPGFLTQAIPSWLETLVLGTPAWKIVAAVAAFGLAAWLAALWAVFALRRAAAVRPVPSQLWRLTVPVVVCLLVLLARGYVIGQVVLSGTAFHIAQAASLAAVVIAAAWMVRTLIGLVGETVVAAPTFAAHDYDSHLVRLVARVAGLIAAASVVIYGANLLGVPLLGLVAGVGVGGFALALAAQSTVENLFGGVSIFADRPFRVGDFIIYDGGQGYVESIGPRSTRIRALDGMQITVPNADLARMQVTNKTCRDSTLFRHTLGFTYAASPAALAEFSRRMLEEIGHCPLDGAAELPPWVRVVALRPASIDVEVRADLVARDENDFSRQQEQLLLAAMAHAEALGLTFADPHAVNVTLPSPAAV